MIIHGSQAQMSEKASSLIYKALVLYLKNKENVVLAVPGGRSVVGIYDKLRTCALPWKRIHIFLLDERLVPADHPESNYRLVKEHMGNEIATNMIYQFKYSSNNPNQSIADYNYALNRCGGRFDIVLASSGEDGHIASLFPEHHSITRQKSGFFLIDDSPKPPPARMSASCELIRQADTGIVLFLGSGKRTALKNFQNKQLSYHECPAKIMAQLPHHYLLTDLEVDTQ